MEVDFKGQGQTLHKIILLKFSEMFDKSAIPNAKSGLQLANGQFISNNSFNVRVLFMWAPAKDKHYCIK